MMRLSCVTFFRLLLVLAAVSSVATLHASSQHGSMSVLERFLAMGDGPVVEYRALRHLEAKNAHFKASAWMDAWTEYDQTNGFRFQIVGEGGSGYIRSHVLRAALEGERKMWAKREPQKASFSRENYEFHDRGGVVEGLTPLGVTPRRKDVLLIDGSIFLHPDDGELKAHRRAAVEGAFDLDAPRGDRPRVRSNRRRSRPDLD